MADEILTIYQVAQYLKVCDKTVRRLINNKRLVASKVGNRTWRIKRADIEEYLQINSNGSGGVATNE